jgi:hypothetical protein
MKLVSRCILCDPIDWLMFRVFRVIENIIDIVPRNQSMCVAALSVVDV